jgi:hypothetical protein
MLAALALRSLAGLLLYEEAYVQIKPPELALLAGLFEQGGDGDVRFQGWAACCLSVAGGMNFCFSRSIVHSSRS